MMMSPDPTRGAVAAVPPRDPPPRWIPAETAGASATSIRCRRRRFGARRPEPNPRGFVRDTRRTSGHGETHVRVAVRGVFSADHVPGAAADRHPSAPHRDLGLAERPEQVNKYFAVEFSASMLKPAYALLSDLCPIFGRRRMPYMALGAFAYAVALQFYARVDSIPALYAAGVSSVVVFAICETGADGAPRAAERRRLEEGHARAERAGMLVRSAGSFTATALSIPLLKLTDARMVIALAGVFASPPPPPAQFRSRRLFAKKRRARGRERTTRASMRRLFVRTAGRRTTWGVCWRTTTPRTRPRTT